MSLINLRDCAPTKLCGSCQQPRPLRRFPTSPYKSDGHLDTCLDCIVKRSAKERQVRQVRRAAVG